MFETTVALYIKDGLVDGLGFVVDAGLISAGVQKQSLSTSEDRAARKNDPNDAPQAGRSISMRWMMRLFGARTIAKPKFPAHADPASHWTSVRKGSALFAYSQNYLIDTGHGSIVDVVASRSNKTVEAGTMLKMLDQTEERFGVKPKYIAADTAYGPSDDLVWLGLKRQILRFIPVYDNGDRTDETFAQSDFTWGDKNDRYFFPGAAKRCGTFGARTRIQSVMPRIGAPKGIGR
ncbi:hypothetical protein [uncultured Roseobacter sp.]|uniref:hypothetical protein n=1 Tax=uncultured Roseobacter sp. TaxID=114847 RepID=UPI002630DF56|nr:hypothetical protein [uncultured Roseobacter sp.]